MSDERVLYLAGDLVSTPVGLAALVFGADQSAALSLPPG